MRTIRRALRLARFAAAGLVPSLALAALPVAEPPDSVVFFGRDAIVVTDHANFEVRGTVPHHEGFLQTQWTSGDGRRIAFISQAGIFRIKDPAWLTVVDLEADRLVAEKPLGYGMRMAVATAEGRIGLVLLAGREAKKGMPAEGPELLCVATESGEISARVTLAELPSAVLVTADGGRVLLVHPGNLKPRKPGRLELRSVADLAPVGELALPGPVGDLFWNGDRSRLLVLDPGLEVKPPATGLPGRIYAIDPAGAAGPTLVADLELGVGTGRPAWDDVRGVFYIVTRPPKKSSAPAMLRVLEGDAIGHEIALPRVPIAVLPAPDRARFVVLDEQGLTLVDSELTRIEGAIPLSRRPANLLFLQPPGRAIVHHEGSSVVSAVDLDSRKVLGEIVTGRTGKKIGLFAAAVGVGVLGQMQSQMMYGTPYAMAPVVMPSDPSTAGLMAPDGGTAYLWNSETNDVTVVDTATHQAIEKFGGGQMQFVEGGRKLAALQAMTLVTFDVAARKLDPEVSLGANGGYFCPCGEHLYNGVGLNKGVQRFDLAAHRMSPLREGLSGAPIFVRAARPESAAPEPAPAPAAMPSPAAPSAPTEPLPPPAPAASPPPEL